LQCSIPSTTEFNKITQAFRPRKRTRWLCQCSALETKVSYGTGRRILRKWKLTVQPRTSKGITASRYRPHPLKVCGPLTLRLSGLIVRAWFPKGLARTLSRHSVTAHPFARVATVRRYPNSPQDRPTLFACPAFPVPGGVAHITQ
jgi:hypothetical protein